MGYTFQLADEVVNRAMPPVPDTKGTENIGDAVCRNDDLKQMAEAAQLRLALIMPAYQNLHDKASNTKYFEELSLHEITLPDGRKKRFRPKTFQKWLELYRKGGIEALMPGARSDKGSTRALDQGATDEILRLKAEHPRLNASQIHAHLVKNGFIPQRVSVSTVQRYIKNNNLKGEASPEIRDRKAFEADAFGKLWQADTCQLCMIDAGGVYKWVYVMGIIDDHSRLITGVECFYQDNAVNFQKVFADAVRRHGIPALLLCDNGAPYSNEQLSLICGSLGTALVHLRPYDGPGKGKIERWWKSLQMGLLAWLNTREIHSCGEMTDKVREWARDYNLRPHSAIGGTPFERYEASKERYAVRHPVSEEWLEECFHNRIIRKVRRDCTVSISCVSYDVPPQFARQKVEIRFVPDRIHETAYILSGKERFPIRPTDRNENCRTKRRHTPVIDYAKIGMEV